MKIVAKYNAGSKVRRFIGSETITKFSKPEVIVTNEGKELSSKKTVDWFRRKFLLRHRISLPDKPNGRVVRLNGNLSKCQACTSQRSWASGEPPIRRLIGGSDSWSQQLGPPNTPSERQWLHSNSVASQSSSTLPPSARTWPGRRDFARSSRPAKSIETLSP